MAQLPGAGATLRSAFGSPAMRRVLFGYLTFAATEWGAWVAILVYAFQQGGSATVGLVAVVQLVPAIFTAPLGSTLSERLSRKAALVVAYAVLASSMLVLWLTVVLQTPTWTFYLAAVASNCTVTLCRPAHFAALPRFADSASGLVAANSASSTFEHLGGFLGASLITVVTPWLGLSAVFLILALVEVTAVLVVATIRAEAPTAAARELQDDDVEPQSFFIEAAAGFREVRRTEGAPTLMLLVGVQFVIVGLIDVLSVVFPQEVLGTGPSGPSVILAVAGIGGLVGAAATITLVGRRRLSPPIFWGFLVSGLFLAVVAASQHLAEAAVLIGLVGLAQAFVDVAGRTLLQRTVREEVLARVFGLQESIVMAGMAVGAVIAPLAVAWAGARGAFVLAGLIPAGLAVVAWPSLRRLDREAALPGPEFAILRSIPLFTPLPQARLEFLAREAVSHEVDAGQVIVRQGDAGDVFYVVTSGRVVVRHDDIEVNRIGAGGHFGEVSLLRDAPRNATVVADEPTRLLMIDREHFLSAVTGSASSRAEAQRLVRERDDYPDSEE